MPAFSYSERKTLQLGGALADLTRAWISKVHDVRGRAAAAYDPRQIILGGIVK